jgi:hypothetical protein
MYEEEYFRINDDGWYAKQDMEKVWKQEFWRAWEVGGPESIRVRCSGTLFGYEQQLDRKVALFHWTVFGKSTVRGEDLQQWEVDEVEEIGISPARMGEFWPHPPLWAPRLRSHKLELEEPIAGGAASEVYLDNVYEVPLFTEAEIFMYQAERAGTFSKRVG